MTTKLGLPLEYQKLPQYFDAFNIADDTDLKNSVIEKILKKYQVKTVLDLTCGTGSQALFLAKRGYKVVGADFSADLLKIARIKAKKENLDVQFIHDDMRNLKAGKFDAAITIFNAVGHLTKSGFEKAMKNINQNLCEGGIYVFDIFNLESMSKRAVQELEMHLQKKVGDEKIDLKQYSKIDHKTGRLTSFNNYIIYQKSGAIKKIRQQFTLQIYSAKELEEMLERAGFMVLSQYGIKGEKFLPKKTISILTIAEKI